MIHAVFLKDAPLAEIVAGRKRFEFRLGLRRIACDPVREGDLLLLKHSGGESMRRGTTFFRQVIHRLL